MVMDQDFFARHRPVPAPAWTRFTAAFFTRVFRARGVQIDITGRERLDRGPHVLALNATHQYDLLPIRFAFHQADHKIVTLSKGKNYHGLAMRTFCVKLGSVPITSRGYLIVMDFLALHGRKPDDEEYRALRNHLDHGTRLPDTPELNAVLTRPRRILGAPFSHSQTTWRAAVLALFGAMMSRTIALSRETMAHGYDVQIFPQGSSATRLSEGRIGAVQLAHALDVPLLPVGINGCLQVFPRHRSPHMVPGRVELRVGEPYRPDLSALKSGFVPFNADHEREAAPVLRAATDELMERINALLDPSYQWAEDRVSDGAGGVQRFA